MNSCKTIVQHAAVYEILKREKADGTYESAMPSCSYNGFTAWLLLGRSSFFLDFSQEKDSLLI